MSACVFECHGLHSGLVGVVCGRGKNHQECFARLHGTWQGPLAPLWQPLFVVLCHVVEPQPFLPGLFVHATDCADTHVFSPSLSLVAVGLGTCSSPQLS